MASVTLLAPWIIGYRRIHAWGDTHEDADLLALAHTRIYRGRDISDGPLPQP